MSGKYKVVGDLKRGFAVVTQQGGIEYDLLETKKEAVAIRNILNRGIGPEWDAVEKELNKSNPSPGARGAKE